MTLVDHTGCQPTWQWYKDLKTSIDFPLYTWYAGKFNKSISIAHFLWNSAPKLVISSLKKLSQYSTSWKYLLNKKESACIYQRATGSTTWYQCWKQIKKLNLEEKKKKNHGWTITVRRTNTRKLQHFFSFKDTMLSAVNGHCWFACRYSVSIA